MPQNLDNHLKSLILSAGLGTRLRPLTDTTPKPLATVHNVPLIEAAFRLCLKAGATDFAINTHHLASILEGRAKQIANSLGINHLFVSEELPEILGTGGALAKIAVLWGDEDLLVYNGDVVSDLPLIDLVTKHRASSNLVTMAVRPTPPRDGGRSVWLGKDGRVRFISKKSDLPANSLIGELTETGFACAYIARPKLRQYLPTGVEFYDVIEAFSRAIQAGESIGARSYQGIWADVGTPRALWETNLAFAAIPDAERHSLLGPAQRILSTLPPSTIIDESSVVAANVSVGHHATIERSVLLSGAIVQPGENLRDILRGGGFQERFKA